jgi:hypothetical protein
MFLLKTKSIFRYHWKIIILDNGVRLVSLIYICISDSLHTSYITLWVITRVQVMYRHLTNINGCVHLRSCALQVQTTSFLLPLNLSHHPFISHRQFSLVWRLFPAPEKEKLLMINCFDITFIFWSEIWFVYTIYPLTFYLHPQKKKCTL